MTFKEWLRQIDSTKANQLDTLSHQAERQREINEDVSVDSYFNGKELTKGK